MYLKTSSTSYSIFKMSRTSSNDHFREWRFAHSVSKSTSTPCTKSEEKTRMFELMILFLSIINNKLNGSLVDDKPIYKS